MNIHCLLPIFLMMHLSSGYAEEPPQLTEKLRQNSQEHLKVEVLHVEQQDFSRKESVEIYVKARLKILAVRRSSNALKYNYQINLNYLHSYTQREGGTLGSESSILPIVKTGQIFTVFLNRIKGMTNTYKPAAMSGSFQF